MKSINYNAIIKLQILVETNNVAAIQRNLWSTDN